MKHAHLRIPLRHASRQARIDALVIAILAVSGLALAIAHDGFALLVEFVEGHESWELDEIILVVAVTGLAGFVYSIRRLRELRRETNRRVEAEGEVKRLAFNDPLTGLPNRRSFEVRIGRLVEQSLKEDSTFAVLLVDLDNFKFVNDVHGHATGDALLVAIGDRLQAEMREGDFAARLGGDEFVLVARSAGRPGHAAALAQRVATAIATPIEIGDRHVEVGVSIGISMFPGDAATPTALMQRADLALYRSKQEGRGQVRFFEPSMDAVVRDRVRIENALRRAIREDAVDVHFQPIIDIGSRDLIGFEALARWSDSEIGEIPPAVFIQVAEDAALISQLSDMLFTKACREAVKWPPSVSLSFNISPLQLRDKTLGLRLMKVLAEVGIAPSRLVIEITEGAIVREYESAQRVLEDLRAAGVRVALDDFGTGYSSLAQLSHFRFDKIKIDRSFVGQALVNQDQATLVRAIIGIGRGLGLETTAEGVETAEQLAFLQNEGCRIGQGFLFSPAVTGEEALAMVTDEGMRAARPHIAGRA